VAGRGIDPTLQVSLERGQYEVDSREVAEAVLRSWMLVAPEAGQRSLGTEEDESGSR
jgi:hypothetical protein